MKRTIVFTTALASAIGLVALGAQAQGMGTQAQIPAQAADFMSIAQIATLLEGQGYTVLEIELERGRYEVEMRDANGMRVEAYLNPITGEVLPYRDDDDYRDDDRSERDDD
ncbi:PepSY domain-containing protein [Rhodobacteraceae bacterium N5(2021)]|uniref:PepSY domain-containing protein n=1 Tax=Gymnodinialimonas phycosphaerae TaxID=2841589 RepID=A0A975YE75_9RHOB|nr:PepSY domain-containing protein [Gymnodinialimonas phycosphaerae]MBY4893333.1 PepSY domain-containing protein [Gymnodinialimonas phycosphaerae]